MTGECTYPIYHQRVVSVDKGSVIIRYKKNKLAYRKKFLRGGEPRSQAAMFQAWLGGESNPTLPQSCFKLDRRVYLSDIPSESCRYCITLSMENALHNLQTDTIISAGDALMVTHLYQKARRVTHLFTRFFFTQVENDNTQIL
jgi:hypothetical protein